MFDDLLKILVGGQQQGAESQENPLGDLLKVVLGDHRGERGGQAVDVGVGGVPPHGQAQRVVGVDPHGFQHRRGFE